MREYTLRWNRSNTEEYNVYRADYPGAEYTLVGTVEQENDPALPTYNRPEFKFFNDAIPKNASAIQTNRRMLVKWEDAFVGSPFTFKISDNEEITPNRDFRWFNETIPNGASWLNNSGIELDESRSLTGLRSIKIVEEYLERPRFSSASYQLPPNSYIIIWLFIDPELPPDSIWFEFQSNNSWEHRIYYGLDLCPYGKNGTSSRHYGGVIPGLGGWVPLIFHTNQIDITSHISGMGFGLKSKNKNSVVLLDSVWWSEDPVYSVDPPVLGIKGYNVYRDGKIVAQTQGTEFFDMQAKDLNARAGELNYLIQEIEPDNNGGRILIKWQSKIEDGTEYRYEIRSVDTNGNESSSAECSGVVNNNNSHIEVYVAKDKDLLDGGSEFLGETTSFEIIHSNVEPLTTYWYLFKSFDNNNEVIAETIASFTSSGFSLLDHFILDYGILQ